MFNKFLLLCVLSNCLFAAGGNHDAHLSANDFNIMWLIPFIGILLSIAIMPLISMKFWHKNYGKVSGFWSAIFCSFLF